MANRASDLPCSDPRRASGPGRSRQDRRAAASLIWLTLILSILSVSSAAAQPLAAPDSEPVRRIIVSLQENRLWLTEGSDTLLVAPVAVGRKATFRHGSKVYNWETPRGERLILDKRLDPVWNVPDWHYYERAARENRELVEMVRGRQYPLADGSHLETRGANVVRVLGQQFWVVPRGREIIIDGVLYAPPVGTLQRRVPGALGTRALDLGEGYLIHGTTPYNQSSIGNAASHGCIRMHTDDVERLYELVNTGTPVLIY